MSSELTVIVAVAVIAIAIGSFVLIGKRNESGYNANAADRDGDGIVQEGTKWERPAGTVKIVPKKAPAKKTSTATAAKKPAAKKAPAKKAAPKKK